MTTLAELRSQVRFRLDEPLTRYWEDSDLNTLINDGLSDIARRTKCLRKDKLYTVRADKPTYTAPDDLLKIYRVEYRQDSSYSYALEYRDLLGMDEVWYTSRQVTGSQPTWWSFWGTVGSGESQLYLYPVPSETINDGLLVQYFAFPRPLIEDTDEADIPNGWGDLVTLYVETHARRKESKDSRWRDSMELYERGLDEMQRMTLHPTDQQRYISEGFTPWLDEWSG